MKKILLILLVAMFSFTNTFVNAQASAPVVNSFFPNTGFIGSSVTITGANFDAIPANNQVFFGATQATVTAASFGQLTVTVPSGATYGPISVRNASGLIGTSSYPFNGIFCGTPINSTTYATLSYSVNVSGGYQMLSQDIDLDGKPDVLVCGFTSNRVSIMRNLSTPGTYSFAPKFDLIFSGATRCIAPADYDGDGKVDLAVVDNGINGVRIFRNTSVPGTISFAATSVIINNIGGYQCAAGDLNNDGKTDLAVGSNSNVVTLRNTSTPGNISFAQSTTVGVGGFVTGLVVTDVDGDGIKDIGAANAGGNTLHAIRNTTAANATTFTFGTLQTFPTGAYPYRLFVGDFDKDGKIDFVDNDFSGASVSIFRNTSTPGTISFATKVTLASRSSNYRMGVGDADGDGRPDIVSKSSGENFFSVYVNTSSSPGSITFAPRVDYPDPAEVSGIVIADLDGDYVPDISTSGINSNALKIFRNTSTVIDNTPPTAMCKNITVALSPSGTVNVTAAMIDNGSSDACGIGSIKINNSASVTYTCANIGANTVTLLVTDRAGNQSSCTATVTVAPAAIIVAGQSTVCQGQTVALSANLGDSYQWQKDGMDIPGATAQTYAASVTGSYTVTVTNAGGCSGTSAPTAVTVNNNPTVNTVPSGTASLCPPNGSVTIAASTSSVYQWKLNGNNIAGATQQNLNATAAGTYTLQVIDLFGCSATSAPIVVNATDNVAPTAKAKNVTLVIAANGTAAITLADINDGSYDNCGSVTVTVTAGKLNYTCDDAGKTLPVTFEVKDAAGNTSTATAMVTVTDPNSVCNHAPIAVSKPLTITANANCQAVVVPSDFDGGSSDVDAGDILTFSVFPAGPYAIGVTNVTLTVTDSKGASSTSNTTITVEDKTAPVVSGVPADIEAFTGVGSTTCGKLVSWTAPTAVDNCGTVTVTSSHNPGDNFLVGVTKVTYTFTDGNNNVSTVSFNVTVADNTLPVVNINNLTVQLDANGNATITKEQVNNNSTDNCAIATIELSKTNFNCANVGANTVVLTVTDIHGNIATANALVTVEDKIAPSVTAVANQVVCANAVGSNYTFPSLSASDNCSIASVTYTVTGATTRTGTGYDASGTFNIGTSVITFTVTDASGNATTSTTTIKINPLPVAAITPATPDALCNTFTLAANAAVGYEWLYNNASAGTAQNLTLGLTNGDGVYSLNITDVNGCKSATAATYTYQKQNLVNSYTILAYKEVELGKYNQVASGSVGVMTAKGEAEFKKYSAVNGAGSFVKAPKIEKDGSGINIATSIYGIATVTLPTMQVNNATTKYLPNYTVNQNTTITLGANYNYLTVKKGANVTVNGNSFGTIKLEEGASIRFTNTVLNIETFMVEKGAKNGNLSFVRFAPNTSVRVSKRVSIGTRVRLNEENYKVTFYLSSTKKGDNDDDEGQFRVKGNDTIVIANILAPQGKIMVTSNESDDDKDHCNHYAHTSKDCRHKGHEHNDCDHRAHTEATCNDQIFMTGLFVANEVESEGNTVIWNNYNCNAPAPTMSPLTVAPQMATFDKLETVNEIADELKVAVMPNPSTSHFTIKLSSKSISPVRMTVVDGSGRVVESRPTIAANSTISIGYNYVNGTYYAEMIQDNKRKVVQLIKVK
ncbi:MAG: FG-GAP-like repeat-containing protein [Sediminibacterium sp.]|nr:FG-GAP-like repeat-containing protein [Sediminibacterium sp.]